MNFTTIKQKIKKILIWSQKYTKTDMVYLVKNSFWTGIGKMLSTISGLIILIILTRFVPKDTVGQYNFFLSILAIVVIFSIPGLNNSTIEATAKNYDGVYEKTVETSFKWSWFGSLIFILLGFFYLLLKNNSTFFIIFLISGLSFPFLYAPNTWRSFLIGKQKFKQLNILSSLQSILYLVTMILVIILSHGNLIWIISSYLLIQMITNLFNYYFSQKYIQNDTKNNDWKNYGFFLTKMQILNLISTNIDKLIIGIFINMETLAIYSVANKMNSSFQNFIQEFINIYSPKIARRSKINFKKIIFATILISVISIISIILVPLIIKIIFPNYEASIILGQLFLIFLPLWFFDCLLTNETTYNLKNKKIIFYKNIITPLVYFLLLVPATYFLREIGLVIVVSLKSLINIIIFFRIYFKENVQRIRVF